MIHLFDYNSGDRACLYIALQSLASVDCSRTSIKNFDPYQEAAKRPVVIGKHAPQKTKSLLRIHNIQGKCIVIKDSGCQQRSMKNSSETKLVTQSLKKSKQSKKAGKDANQTNCTTLLESFETSTFDGNIRESFSLGSRSLALFEDTVLKDLILNWRLPLSTRLRWGHKALYGVCISTDLHDRQKTSCFCIFQHWWREVLKGGHLAPPDLSSTCPYECYSSTISAGVVLQFCKDTELCGILCTLQHKS